jgi:hypothetical protein
VLDAHEEDRAQYRGDLARLHEMNAVDNLQDLGRPRIVFQENIGEFRSRSIYRDLEFVDDADRFGMAGRSLARLVSFLSDCCPKFPS